jgi:glycosyltransferase involved in cell wall biosynthesis
MRRPVGIAWTLSSYHGWGVLGVNLALGLLRKGYLPIPLAEPSLSLPEEDWQTLAPALEAGQEMRAGFKEGASYQLGFPVLHPVENGMRWNEKLKGAPDLGITFFENTRLDPAAVRRGQSLVRLITGCRWADTILRERGFANTALRPQGIDPKLFAPAPKPTSTPTSKQGVYPGRFVVFSGGKLEFRKGQDLALEGFKRFQARHPEALLLTAWQNPWPESAATILRSPLVKSAPRKGRDEPVDVAAWVAEQDVPAGAHVEVGFVAHAMLPGLLRDADVALFTSRAESGTNLMAMEALALGLPSILSANTGHLDLIGSVPCLPLARQSPVTPLGPEDGVEGWGESDPGEIDQALERSFAERAAMAEMGRKAALAMRDWTWEARIDAMIEGLALEELYA